MGEQTGHPAVDGLSNEATLAGSLAELGVLDLLQAIADTKRSAALRIRSEEQVAELFFRDGDLIDAELGTLRGERAVYTAVTWTEGQFDVEFKDIPRGDAMRTSTRRVLWEGRRRLEERTRRVAQLPALSSVFEVDCAKLLENLAELPDEMNLVLKHFDGDRPLFEILTRCDLDELTTLSAFARLIAEGVIFDRQQTTEGAGLVTDRPTRERPPPLVSTLPPPRATVRSTLDYELDAQARDAASAPAAAHTTPSPLPERPPGERTLRGMRAPHVATEPPRAVGEPSPAIADASPAREVDVAANSRPTVRAAPLEAHLEPPSIAPESIRRRRRRRRRSVLSDAQPSRRLRSFATLARDTPLLASPALASAPATPGLPASAIAVGNAVQRDPAPSAPAARKPVRTSLATPDLTRVTTERSRVLPTAVALALVGLLVSAMVWLAKLAGK